ncbi:hypothetical protein PVL29_004860 [Vitis rotundifolia]|uniref:Uncharacterized protein n=1 Tax=Vitis rotundifolia TaxID=103349 RepID=A0AA39E1J1_VITRO|nr:hypothetical protein PVL29_004860 [Vitis rotundifolia]
MEGKGVVLIATKQRLLFFDVTKLEDLPYTDTEVPTLPLPVVKEFNFVEKGFPFGAGFIVWESKLYMVGGEKTRGGLSEEELCTPSNNNLDKSFGTRGLSPYIYFSDLTKLDSITEFRKHSLTMLAPKTSPIIEEIEGKIYVLSGPACHYEGLLPNPSFEAYDPSLDQLEALDLPHFYRENRYSDPEYIVHGHSVVGTDIVVLAGEQYYYYIVKDRNWELGETPIPRPLLPGYSGKFVPAYDDIFICFRLHALFAAKVPSDAGPTLIQFLDEVYKDNFFLDLDSLRGVVVAIGEYEMCIIRPKIVNINNVIIPRIYVATFLVEKLDSSAPAPKRAKIASDSQTFHDNHGNYSDRLSRIQDSDDSEPFFLSVASTPFLSVTCLSKGFYTLPEQWGHEKPQICSAFFHPWSVFTLVSLCTLLV